ncbi:MAG: type II toxin-antitoxin system RelE/ParE family toxin [Phycicoccus sp.]
MKAYRLTPAAQQDLSQIWDYTQQRWDTAQAETYLLEIEVAIERIGADPVRGRSCDEVRQGYRRYAIGSHLVFYRETPDSVDVIRILHQRMDPTRYL